MRMSLNNITSAELRKLIWIVERKERVQEELTEIESKLSTYLSPEPITPATQSPRRTRKSRAVRVSKPPLEVKAPKPKVRQVESKDNRALTVLKFPFREVSPTLALRTTFRLPCYRRWA